MDALVLYLVSLMGHDKQIVRETAHQILCPLNRSLDLRKSIERAGAKYKKDAEIAHRLRQIDLRYRLIFPSGRSNLPLTASMKKFIPEEIFLPFKNLDVSYHTNNQIDYDVNSRALCKDLINELFSKGWSRGQVQRALDKAIAQERSNGIVP